MWYMLVIFILGMTVTYIVAITLEKVFHRIGKTKKKKKKSTYMTRRERMRSYNKRN